MGVASAGRSEVTLNSTPALKPLSAVNRKLKTAELPAVTVAEQDPDVSDGGVQFDPPDAGEADVGATAKSASETAPMPASAACCGLWASTSEKVSVAVSVLVT